MKIVLDFRKYDGVIGGVEQGVIQLTRHITDAGHSIVLLCKEKRFQETDDLFNGMKNLKIKWFEDVINCTQGQAFKLVIISCKSRDEDYGDMTSFTTTL